MSRFIAAMDHSGGSTGGVLERYGQEYTEADKMDKVHAMRMRMVNSPDFNDDNISAAILYKDTVKRGMVRILAKKDIASFLKIDNGCNSDGTLKQFPIKQMISFAFANNCYGTKMRSIVHDRAMIEEVLSQQLTIAETIYKSGLIPIVEPEIPIGHPNKELVELRLLEVLLDKLDWFDGRCILKITPPEQPNLYHDLIKHRAVKEVVFLSGGYSTSEACSRLSLNDNVRASFSRALSERLLYDSTEDEFNVKISSNIKMIKYSC